MALPSQDAAPKRLYLGIDLGKDIHCIAYLLENRGLKETQLQTRTEMISNTTAGFEKLLRKIRTVGCSNCVALCEHTGHYGDALIEYLQSQGVLLYRIHIQEKTVDKTDERDAKYLAELLYQQAGLHIKPIKSEQQIHPFLPSTPAARQLRGLVQRHYELTGELVRIKNRLADLQNRLFPEFTQIIKDPNGPTALAIRRAFPTPESVASATLADLVEQRGRATKIATSAIIQLQQLARRSIGAREYQDQMVLEQKQLIDFLALVRSQIDTLEQAMSPIVQGCRDGQILLSFPAIGLLAAAYIIAGIGSIANFVSASKLCGYFGWSANRKQSGKTYDTVKFSRSGNRILKSMIYFVVLHAIKEKTVWAEIYAGLVERKCPYDGRKQKRTAKMKCVVRIGNQIIRLVWLLLMKDHELLQGLPEGVEPPPPTLYDANYHRAQTNAKK